MAAAILVGVLIGQIQTRGATIKACDGRRVVIPNAELFINPVTVNTAFAQRRREYDIGIGYGGRHRHAAARSRWDQSRRDEIEIAVDLPARPQRE
jgi:hypothetical protein